MKTRLILFCVTLVLLCVSSAYARLGETVEECQARYRPGCTKEVMLKRQYTSQSKGFASAWFHKDGLQIDITFWDGVATSISYSKIGVPLDGKNAFSEAEVLSLAENNKGALTWKEKPMSNNERKLSNAQKRELRDKAREEKQKGDFRITLDRTDGATCSYGGANSVTFRLPSKDASPHQNNMQTSNTAGF